MFLDVLSLSVQTLSQHVPQRRKTFCRTTLLRPHVHKSAEEDDVETNHLRGSIVVAPVQNTYVVTLHNMQRTDFAARLQSRV